VKNNYSSPYTFCLFEPTWNKENSVAVKQIVLAANESINNNNRFLVGSSPHVVKEKKQLTPKEKAKSNNMTIVEIVTALELETSLSKPLLFINKKIAPANNKTVIIALPISIASP
jgi:hypothetical protein